MKQYLEQRIKELEKQWDEYQTKLHNEKSENKSNYYYAKLEAINMSIRELDKVLKMVD